MTNRSVQALAPKRRAWSGEDELAVVMDGCDWNYMLRNVWRIGLYLWTNFSRKSSAACETNVHIKLPNFLKKRQLFMHMIWNLTWRDIFSLKKKHLEGNLESKQNSNFVQKLIYKIILLGGMTSWSCTKSNMLIK